MIDKNKDFSSSVTTKACGLDIGTTKLPLIFRSPDSSAGISGSGNDDHHDIMGFSVQSRAMDGTGGYCKIVGHFLHKGICLTFFFFAIETPCRIMWKLLYFLICFFFPHYNCLYFYFGHKYMIVANCNLPSTVRCQHFRFYFLFFSPVFCTRCQSSYKKNGHHHHHLSLSNGVGVGFLCSTQEMSKITKNLLAELYFLNTILMAYCV